MSLVERLNIELFIVFAGAVVKRASLLPWLLIAAETVLLTSGMWREAKDGVESRM